MKICSIKGCEKKHCAKTFCSMHYTRYKKYSDPLFTKKTPDGEILEWIYEVPLKSNTDECINCPYDLSKRYPRIIFNNKAQPIGNFILEKIVGLRPEGMEMLHSCGHSRCCNPSHLSWGTRSDNYKDKIRHGTDNSGQRCSMAKLTEDDILEIRRRAANGETHTSIAKDYPVTRATISKIVRREIWKHI